MSPSLAGIVVGFLTFGAILWPIEKARGFLTDVAYWFFTPFVTRGITGLAVVAAVVVLAILLGVPLDPEHVRGYFADPNRTIRQQPIGLQVIEVLLIGDLVGYWSHRLFHGRTLWRFHAVHHGSKDLDRGQLVFPFRREALASARS